jgi:hypothetical protein
VELWSSREWGRRSHRTTTEMASKVFGGPLFRDCQAAFDVRSPVSGQSKDANILAVEGEDWYAETMNKRHLLPLILMSAETPSTPNFECPTAQMTVVELTKVLIAYEQYRGAHSGSMATRINVCSHSAPNYGLSVLPNGV